MHTVGSVFAQISEKHDAAAVSAAEADAKRYVLDRQNAVKQTLGQSARGVTEREVNDFRKFAKETDQKFSSNRARSAYANTIGQLELGLASFASGHEIGQVNEAVVQTARADISMTTELVANNPTNSAMLAGGRAKVIANANTISDVKQFSADSPDRAAAVLTATSGYHAAIISKLSSIDPAIAAAYFDSNKKEIAAEQQNSISNILSKDTSRREAQAVVDDALARGLSETETLAEARKLEGDARDLAVQEAHTRFAERKRITSEDYETGYSAGLAMLNNGGSLTDIPGPVWDQMGEKNERVLKKIGRGEDVVTDNVVYEKLRLMAARDSKAFLGARISDFREELSSSDIQSLIELQAKAAKDPDGFKSEISLDDMIRAAQDSAELGGEKNSEERGQMRTTINNTVLAEQKRLGRKLSPDESRKVVNESVVEVSKKRFFGLVSSSAPVFEELSSFPDEERAAVEQDIIDAGKAATPKNVLTILRLRRDRAAK